MSASIIFDQFDSFSDDPEFVSNLDEFTSVEIDEAVVAASWLFVLSKAIYGSGRGLVLHVNKYQDGGVVYSVIGMFGYGPVSPFGNKSFAQKDFVSHVSFALAALERVKEHRGGVA